MTLVERLCAATAANRDLDAEIAACVGVRHRSRRTAGGKNKGREWLVDTESGGVEIWSHHPPAFTASLDAAMTLVPDGHEWLRKDPGVMTVYRVPTGDKEWARHIDAAGATPALALCIASLRARESA